MKLANRSMAGQKLSLSSGVVEIDADGCVEVEDKAVAEALQRSGFKPVFARKDKPESKETPKSEPKEVDMESKKEEPKELPKSESLSTSKVESHNHNHNYNKKKGK